MKSCKKTSVPASKKGIWLYCLTRVCESRRQVSSELAEGSAGNRTHFENHVVVQDDLAVGGGNVVGVLSGVIGVLTRLALAVLALGSREVLALEAVDLVNDDGEDSRRVLWVGRRASDVGLLGRVDGGSLDLRKKAGLLSFNAAKERRELTYLEFGVILQLLGKVVVDSRLGLERGVELRLLVVGDRPGEGAVERVGVCRRIC